MKNMNTRFTILFLIVAAVFCCVMFFQSIKADGILVRNNSANITIQQSQWGCFLVENNYGRQM